MNAKFRSKKSKKNPDIATASLPDIIFMLLFFFMVATTMRESELIVRVKVPQATEITKLEKKSWVSTIYIGTPIEKLQPKFGTAPKIQLNDRFGEVSQVIEFIENERLQKEERVRPYMTFALKIDSKTKMGIVTDVKQELRKANALKITYSARPRGKASI
jgi:biopolymer transport protein ExbD